jgi:hypothetical protein
MTSETRVGQCSEFSVYEMSAGRYSIRADSIELTFDEYGDSFDDAPTTLVDGTPVRMSFELRDGALYERGGEEGPRSAWTAVDPLQVIQLRELLSRNGELPLDIPSAPATEPHPVARFQVKSPDEAKLTLLSDGTFAFSRMRWPEKGGCIANAAPDTLTGWFFVEADELILVPTTEDVEDGWIGDHIVSKSVSQPSKYQLRESTLLAKEPRESPWDASLRPITQMELVSCAGPVFRFNARTGECDYAIGGQ